MNDDNCVWIVAIVVIVAFFGSVTGCTMHENAQIRRAVEAGANPIDAWCAMASFKGSSKPCLVRAAVTGKQP